MGYTAKPVPEIMRRTKKNLQIIQEEREARKREGVQVDKEGHFEVTQLINSFMGAFAHPFEAVFKLQEIPGKVQENLHILEQILNERVETSNKQYSLEEMLGFVRNAFAHGNIQFIGGTSSRAGSELDEEIEAIRIWNCRPTGAPVNGWQQQHKTWQAYLNVSELEKLLFAFIEIMTELPPTSFERTDYCPSQRKMGAIEARR